MAMREWYNYCKPANLQTPTLHNLNNTKSFPSSSKTIRRHFLSVPTNTLIWFAHCSLLNTTFTPHPRVHDRFVALLRLPAPPPPDSGFLLVKFDVDVLFLRLQREYSAYVLVFISSPPYNNARFSFSLSPVSCL